MRNCVPVFEVSQDCQNRSVCWSNCLFSQVKSLDIFFRSLVFVLFLLLLFCLYCTTLFDWIVPLRFTLLVVICAFYIPKNLSPHCLLKLVLLSSTYVWLCQVPLISSLHWCLCHGCLRSFLFPGFFLFLQQTYNKGLMYMFFFSRYARRLRNRWRMAGSWARHADLFRFFGQIANNSTPVTCELEGEQKVLRLLL